MTHSYFDVERPTVLGHRGAAGERPENTLPSFERALELGAHILESDVHLTKDGVPVLLHDADVARTTDGCGAVAHLTLEEIAVLDAGYRFNPGTESEPPFRGQRIRIPTLEEAFERFPGVRFNLEIKGPERELVERVVDLVAGGRREGITLLAAEADSTMETLRTHLATSGVSPAVGASTGDVVRVIQSCLAGEPPPPGPMALQIPVAFGDRPLVTPELVNYAHAHDIQVHVWTINDPAEMHHLLDQGVDGLVTDHPGRMAQVVAERRG